MGINESDYNQMVRRVAQASRRLGVPPREQPSALPALPFPGAGVTQDDFRRAAVKGWRTDTVESKLNKTELAYLAWVRTLSPWAIYVQRFTFLLAWDDRFTPDFVIYDEQGFRAVDTKASYVNKQGKRTYLCEEDAMQKMKSFASKFLMFRMLIAYQDPPGVWNHVEIRP